MKNVKLEKLLEKDIKLKKEGINQLEFKEKSELEIKNINNNIEEKRREEKNLLKGEAPPIETDKNKNDFQYYKNKIRKDSNYEEIKINIKKYYKYNNKRNIINIKKNIYIIIMIFFNLIISNNNIIEYKFSNITLKIKGPGFSDILYSSFNNLPDIIYINGNPNSTRTNRYYFKETINTVNLIWNSPINNCSNMFRGCSNTTEIDLSNFNTSSVTYMGFMFSGCSQLNSLNLSNFNTSSVTYMYSMFYGCSHLYSLNLSNFDTSSVTNMGFMFSGCSQLEYINLKNFTENSLSSFSNIFGNVPENIVACLNENSDKILGRIKEKNCYTLDCSDNWKINQKKLVNKSNICFDISNHSILYKYEYKGLYYENCINGNVTNNKTINYCKCDNEKCGNCLNISLIDNFYEIENDNDEYGYKKCYKDPIGYYLDRNYNIYKKCYYTCEKCEMEGNNITHNCIECNNDYPVELKITNYSNCYNCSYYYYFDDYNNFHCTIDNNCPNEYPILDELECKKRNEIKTIINDLINDLDDKKTKEEEINAYDNILKNLEDIYTSKDYDTTNMDNGNDEIIDIEKVKVILTTSENQKNNINSNMTSMYLGECENSLKKFYNLSDNTTIYIKMLQISQEGMRIPKIEYDIYSKLNGENLEKLNLDVCKNNKISLSIPVGDVDNIDKLNSSSDYYNDFCYTTTSDSGTDISLKDRKEEYPSKAVCQDDCDFAGYNYTTKKAKCECNAKESSSSFADMNIDKKKLLDNFKNIKNIANINILKCVKVLFSKLGISNNAGFFIFIVFIIFHTIILILFYLKKLDLLINKIKYLIFAIKFTRLKKKEKEKQEEKIDEVIELEVKNKKNKEIENNRIKFNEIDDNINNNIINVDDENINNNINNEIVEDNKKIKPKKKRKKKKKKKKKKKEKEVIKEEKEDNIKENKDKDNIININFNIKNIITNGNNINLSEKNTKIEDNKNLTALMDYTEDELNDLSYELALKNDQRSYCQFYILLIKTKHEFIYAFFFNKDYNSKIIKIDLFIFGFALNYAINGLFFNDDTMHNVYESKGLFDVSYQLPIIIYSSFISMFLVSLVQMLGLSNDAIIDFKQSEETNNINERGEKLIKKIKIKFVFYFILSFLLLFCFWYYISMFDAVYRNTQFLLLQDTAMGFALSLFTPFIIYLIPGLFRIPALRTPQQNKRCLYNFSKLFTIL